MNGRWFPFQSPQPDAEMRLFCFPHAGGGATLYRSWPAALGPEIEVWAAQPPGRENRFHEEPYRRMEPLVHDLVTVLEPLLDRPFAFFGYSLGAAIAHETALVLAENFDRRPEHIFVCAQRAPHHKTVVPVPTGEMSDAQMFARVRALDGTPATVLENSELMAILGPLIRADLELNDSYVASRDRVHDCPLSAFGGRADVEVSEPDLDAWSELTRGPFRSRVFEGGHFFIRERAAELLVAVEEAALAAVREVGPRT